VEKTLTTQYERGTGRRKEKAFDIQYTCALCTNFSRLASKLHGTTSALSKHIEGYHKRTEDEVPAGQSKQTGLSGYIIKAKEEIPAFEEALIN
jgi:hypothetical protein